MDDPDEVQLVRREGDVWPWAPGSRNLFVELPWRQLTGVRLGNQGARDAPTAALH
jgi:hypothetical protein